MTIARSQQISLEHTCYYHCVSRCVRRAFLCGKDPVTGKDFSRRRQWIERRLARLVSVFAIDLLAYAVMNNHYHLVLRVNPEKAGDWRPEEVIERWRELFRVPDGLDTDSAPIELWRERLSSLSWFMRCLNEPIARRANAEDNCTGRFWEGRFKCQALLDEAAVLRCMAYVDLNPLRAGLTKIPERAHYTSLNARTTGCDRHLLPLESGGSNMLSISLRDYLKLIDWSGRLVRLGKRASIPADTPVILQRLNIDGAAWRFDMRNYGRWYYRAVGCAHTVKAYCKHVGQQRLIHAIAGGQVSATL